MIVAVKPDLTTGHARAGQAFLTPELSVYLDVVRFCAALTVVFYHGWQDGLYTRRIVGESMGHVAVMAFFVLSGLVIAASTDRPGQTLQRYVVARVARVYSVALPALLFSFLLGALLVARYPDHGSLGVARDNLNLLSFVQTLTFLNESWGSFAEVPLNAPYWSLSYEVWYYVMFGAWAFGRGRWRWIAPALAALVAGPRIVALAPVWWLGVWLLRAPTVAPVPVPVAALLWLATAASIVALVTVDVPQFIHHWVSQRVPGWWRLDSSTKLASDYLFGVLFALHFLAFRWIGGHFAALMRWLRPVAGWLAGYTFTLYLFHRPLTNLLEVLGISAGDSLAGYAGCIVGVVLVCIAIGAVTERRLDVVRGWVGRLLAPLFVSPRIA